MSHLTYLTKRTRVWS